MGGINLQPEFIVVLHTVHQFMENVSLQMVHNGWVFPVPTLFNLTTIAHYMLTQL